jgi:hypothetical protein
MFVAAQKHRKKYIIVRKTEPRARSFAHYRPVCCFQGFTLFGSLSLLIDRSHREL